MPTFEPRSTPQDIFDATVSFLEGLCTISSPTGYVDGLERVMAYYGDALANQGLEVERLDRAGDAAGEPTLVARPRGAPAAPAGVVLIGHLDTVLPAAPPRRDGSTLYAIGSADMKGGLAMLVGALALLAERGSAPPQDLMVLVVPDEEILGPYTRHAVETLAAGARGLWSLEPGKRRQNEETVVIGRRGLCNWRLDVRGQAAHAGSSYWAGRSALAAAAEWCTEATALSRPGEGPTVNVARLVAGEKSFVSDPCLDPALLGSSRQRNVVPDRARVEGEARHLLAPDGPRLIAALEATSARIAAARRVAIELVIEKSVPPMVPRDGSRALAARAQSLAAQLGISLGIEEDRGGLSFPNLLPAGSRTVAIDGLGPAGGGMHTSGEWVDLESFDRRIPLLAALLASEA